MMPKTQSLDTDCMHAYARAVMPQPWLRQLIQDCQPQDKLRLFGVSKTSAAMVVKHSPRIKLHLQVAHRKDNTTELQAKQQAMKALLQPASADTTFHVVLDAAMDSRLESVPVLWRAVPKAQVTYLTLTDLSISEMSTLYDLQLQHCTRLQTLHTMHCTWPFQGSSVSTAVASQLRAAHFPPSLTELRLNSTSEYDWQYDHGILGKLLAPQITSLISNRSPLPSLTHVTRFEYTKPEFRDDVIDAIIHRPSITHVSAPWPYLRRDIRHQSFKWQQLLFGEGADIPSLMHLPVWNIQEIVIHGIVMGFRADHQSSLVDAAASHLARCPHFQCKPRYDATVGMSELRLHGRLTPELISVCAHSLTEARSIWLRWVPSGLSTILSSLPLLHSATNLTGLGLLPMHGLKEAPMPTEDQAVQLWQQFASGLPLSITEVVLTKDAFEEDCKYHVSKLVALLVNQPHRHVVVKVLLSAESATPSQLQQLMQQHPVSIMIVPVSL